MRPNLLALPNSTKAPFFSHTLTDGLHKVVIIDFVKTFSLGQLQSAQARLNGASRRGRQRQRRRVGLGRRAGDQPQLCLRAWCALDQVWQLWHGQQEDQETCPAIHNRKRRLLKQSSHWARPYSVGGLDESKEDLFPQQFPQKDPHFNSQSGLRTRRHRHLIQSVDWAELVRCFQEECEREIVQGEQQHVEGYVIRERAWAIQF